MSVPIVPLSIGESTPGVISIADVTTGTKEGDGVFDVLMRTMALHLHDEYSKGRITGKEYATAYATLATTVLQQSIQYLNVGKQVEKLHAETGLTRQKIVSELANTSDTIPAGIGFNESTAVTGVVSKTKDLHQAQIDGFARDAEQRILKIYADMWAVQRTTDKEVHTGDNGFNDPSCKQIVDIARAGIGAAASSVTVI